MVTSSKSVRRAIPRREQRWWSVARAAFVAALLAGAAGCDGPATVKSVCESAADRDCGAWSGVDECIADGNAIRSRVEAAGGCDGAFQDYLDCHERVSGCAWESMCSEERDGLEDCIGEL